ncbi:hypothetical protein HXA35_01915 [Bacillus sp. A301a_S52]|nr:hypothetical protein [Bacillus sp. A301a_S52]
MTKRHLKLAIMILIISAVIFSINKCQEAKEEKQKEVEEISWYEFALRFFELGTYYERLEDGSIETHFFPTDRTQPKVDRWKLAAEVFPFVEYPEDLISENRWVEAFDLLENLLYKYDDYYESKAEEEQETLVTDEDVEGFIESNEVSDNLQQAFEEAGIDYDWDDR